MATINPTYLWISDSIYANGAFDAAFAAQVPSAGLSHGNYGGTTVGSGLSDLADESYYWTGSTWATHVLRGTSWGGYAGCIFEYGRNDANNAEPLAAFRKGYDKVIAQARKYFPYVLAGCCPPKALGDFSNWDVTDPFQVNSYYSTLLTVAAKYNVPFADHFANYKSLVTLGTNTVAQLMLDNYHPTATTGVSAMCALIGPKVLAGQTMNSAAPEISGRVVNYFYGQPIGGAWALGANGSSTQIPRNTAQTEQMLSSSTITDVVRFPASTCSQIWAHFMMNTPGGQVTIYVDRGLGSQQSIVFDTSTRSDNTMNSVLVADGLSAGPHMLEMQVLTNAAVRVIGATYVGVT